MSEPFRVTMRGEGSKVFLYPSFARIRGIRRGINRQFKKKKEIEYHSGMVARIEVAYKIPDTRAKVKLRRLEELGFKGKIKSAALTDAYVVDANLTQRDLRKAAQAFQNPLVEKAAINQPQSPARFSWAIETGYLPGVTDNVGATAKETIEDVLGKKFKNGQGVYRSQVLFLTGKLSEDDAKRIALTLYNPLIERAEIKSFKKFMRDGGMGARVPKVSLPAYARGFGEARRENISADLVDLEVSDDELARIGKEGVLNRDGVRGGPLALDLQAMRAIRDYFRAKRRKPTDIEIESLAQTWSEHCKHTIFANPIDDIKEGIYRTYIKAATNVIRTLRRAQGKKDFCVSVFTDNSGAIAFDKEYLVTHKVETHNSPSALDPFGGAITGIVGVNRDTIGFGLGAKPVANLYGFCLADPKDETVLYRDSARKNKMLSARRIMDGVIQGINTGGNCSGIPTPQGFLFFDKRYRGKPLVFAGTVGLIPRKVGGKPSYVKQARAGDYIVMAGGRVGQDGIHGATFSSEVMDSGSPATAVQIGDPITQKKMSDALIKEVRDRGWYHSITDNGAGGLSCSVAEMAKESGGCLVHLEKVPLKYPGLQPWQTWISESQERMTLAVPKAKWKKLSALLAKRGVEATVIGEFTASGNAIVKYRGKTIMDIGLEFLHNGLPARHLRTARARIDTESARMNNEYSRTIRSHSVDIRAILAMLARVNIASYEFLSCQYDHEVQAGSVLKPLQGRGRVNADASVLRPVLNSQKGIILSLGIAPSYSEIDAYHMAASAIDTAVRSAVAAGADIDYLALLDNFCWCSSNEPERLFQLKRAAEACYDYAVAYGTPFISGKDSMFNDFKGYDANGDAIKISVPPTLLISSIGVVPDVRKTVSLDLKRAGDLLYVLGETHDELGGSEYAAACAEENNNNNDNDGVFVGGEVPQVNAVKNKKMYRAFHVATRKGLVASAVSVGKGGLAVALLRTAMAGKLGLDISLKNLPGDFSGDTSALFSESQGRIVASIAPARRKEFERVMKGNAIARLGAVTSKETVLVRGMKKRLTLPLKDALTAYRSTFKNF